jgi:hypothetical protein
MRLNIFLYILISFFAMGFSGPPGKTKVSQTMAQQVKWNETDHQFGKIGLGPEAVFTFVFKNKGKKPVTVQSAEPGCSCTVSDYSKDAVGKNKSGKVIVKYGTANRPGWFKKGVKVTFTDGSSQQLTIMGDVVVP